MSHSPADNSPENPFQSPTDVADDYLVRGPGICPYCGDADFERPYFTNWGGYIGPWLLTHAVCRRCGHGFNVNSGTSNLLNIALYQISSVLLVILALAVGFFYILPAWKLL
ncbi:hypothetical protein [Blastopirellula retiformator]|uniref:Uncharacterized protein n=1 Tax=Blastopirellula retiformator TaxID=2527970 RepID=A0A5C5V142_9BACT|nr:hypothetical protein [Blastopirellula retiformator]TWT31683.1 hypothetical protein Enr8_36070 [Blastopirellula retiformator]